MPSVLRAAFPQEQAFVAYEVCSLKCAAAVLLKKVCLLSGRNYH